MRRHGCACKLLKKGLADCGLSYITFKERKLLILGKMSPKGIGNEVFPSMANDIAGRVRRCFFVYDPRKTARRGYLMLCREGRDPFFMSVFGFKAKRRSTNPSHKTKPPQERIPAAVLSGYGNAKGSRHKSAPFRM